MAAEDSPARMLRRRWELASVLDFLHVFEPLMKSELGLSAEEIETALISPNNDLAKLHIALIKGIPPVPKNLKEPNAWISNTSKKLAPWWKWVAEGENPLKPDHGKEIEVYTQLDPIARLLILKALCELRGEQQDVLSYITDELKSGKSIKNFRAESIGTDVNGSVYWYTGDSVIGYRLCKEEFKIQPRSKGKGQLNEPKMDFEWETVATNLDEFNEITEKFSSSGAREEIALVERIKAEILPSLEALVKKKERKIKRQEREATMLEAFRSSIRTSKMRRARKPVSYTYDDYDQRISEAIKESENGKDSDSDSQEDSDSPTGDLQSNNSTSSTGEEQNLSDTSQDEKEQAINTKKQKVTNNPDRNKNPNLGLRRSQRNAGTSEQLGNVTPEAKKRSMQRPVINSEFNNSDSDENSGDYKKARVSGSESE